MSSTITVEILLANSEILHIVITCTRNLANPQKLLAVIKYKWPDNLNATNEHTVSWHI